LYNYFLNFPFAFVHYAMQSKNLFLYTLILLISSCATHKKMNNNTTTIAFRLKPGQDLKTEIINIVNNNKIKAGWIATCVGSLTEYNIRFANQPNGASKKGYFEIVSLVGAVSANGSHLHISVSDSTGNTIGGHLLQGCTIYTTAEIVIQSSNNLIFKREKDGTTPWEELQIEEIKK
jgi:uncharacterized protein